MHVALSKIRRHGDEFVSLSSRLQVEFARRITA